MANQRLMTAIHVPPPEESAPVYLSLQPRSVHFAYIGERWSSERSEALRALNGLDLEKGGGLSVAVVLGI